MLLHMALYKVFVLPCGSIPTHTAAVQANGSNTLGYLAADSSGKQIKYRETMKLKFIDMTLITMRGYPVDTCRSIQMLCCVVCYLTLL